ncbi:SNF2 family DNA or RNA helicase [Arcticibacter tournemirensis]|nr:DEAD/DEAH box helicase [Arcticibacter tournemirensis]TQM51065.1 SNF2 family DNA or RNA helicase [Arcticibacter tournemirensis]
MINTSGKQEEPSGNHRFTLRNTSISDITEGLLLRHMNAGNTYDSRAYQNVNPKILELNLGVFTNQFTTLAFPDVTVVRQGNDLFLSCNCPENNKNLCEHEALVMTALIRRDELRVFFDEKLRHEKLREVAVDYGLENEPDLDNFFELEYIHKKLIIKSRLPSLFAATKENFAAFNDLLKNGDQNIADAAARTTDQPVFVVLRQHKYYQYLFVDLYRSEVSLEGRIKNPLTAVSPLDLMWRSEDPDHLKFFTAVSKFQNQTSTARTHSDLVALRAIVKNPLDYAFYYHDKDVSEKVTARSLVPVKIKLLTNDPELKVNPQGAFYELSGSIKIEGRICDLESLDLRFNYFLAAEQTLYLAGNLQALGIIDLLKKKNGRLLIHGSKYREFKTKLLTKIEDKVGIDYTHIKPATPLQLNQQGFNNPKEKVIYLSDFGQDVMIIPVVRYGEEEVPIRSKRQVYGTDKQGREFLVKRDGEEEDAFTALLLKQHPYFEEQLENDLYYFYLHKKRFLDEEWFLNAFDEWRKYNITILGFNELEGNKLNPHKVKISIKVLSGINWFNAIVNVKYGKKRLGLKQLQKAVRNKNKYVQLDDGTTGILPEEWMEKFAAYFNSAEIAGDDTLIIPKVNFSAVDQLYDAEMLDDEVKEELNFYRKRLSDFESVKNVKIPAELEGTLRSYQREGLNWLNFLDDLGFGGCLADDMGLGKSVQIIAFILSQREKTKHNVNLIVVPASLIFNWQAEVSKFAPSVKIHTIYGADRIKNTHDFDPYEIVLTSYGTLLSDIRFLKDYTFNYIFLDESQNIKNPESQRYKAVRLLKSRNKIVITGTPVENNTFDLYGQLSFACPGLLGSKQYFKDIYSSPVDKFKSYRRTTELQNKIKPFILRRTKQQVASELPDKTEMVLYCEMKPEQRKIYDAYEKEFREYISAATDDELAKSPMNVLKGLTRLRQICNSPLLLKEEKLKGEESVKIEMLTEQIENKSPRHKILVFSQFVSMLDLVGKALKSRNIGYAYLTGSTRDREAVVSSFQNDPGLRVFLISLKAGGTGLNLTEADYVYLIEPWWNPAVENQAIDRSHRIGQDKNVVAVRMICPGTVEEKMMTMQESKRELVQNLIKTDTSFLNSLSKADLLKLLE